MEININSHKSPVTIRTESKELEDFLRNNSFARRYIPEFKIDDIEKRRIIIDSQKNDKFQVELDYPNNISYRGKDIGIETVVLTGYVMERMRQENDVYCVHSSAVSKEGTGIVFIGDKLSGKTTLSIYFSSRGFDFISDEKTLIDLKKMMIVGGNKVIAPNELMNSKEDLDTTRIFRCGYYARLGFIVYPKLNSSSKPRTIEWNQQKVDMYLYAKLSEYIAGYSIRLNNLEYPLETMDSKVLAQKRIKCLENLIKKVRVFTLIGNRRAIFEGVNSLLEGYSKNEY